jgi:hypothetical protein
MPDGAHFAGVPDPAAARELLAPLLAGHSHAHAKAAQAGAGCQPARNLMRPICGPGSGNLLIALYERVCVVAGSTGTFYGQAMTARDIYIIAGTSTAGFNGDGGPAVACELNAASGVAVDRTGGVLIADTQNGRIRMVTN